ncbi:NAD(P)/FAD-dependent oxidoreductase [Pseudactinotalea sp.]|uniref:NAD(P)/FAD-dependent oxidoreductase n=1 Tax=Pseudactinotalea sp. TaxID=1926260 RepID=UPI003B3BB62D
MDRIVVIGAGLTAANAVETLREEGYTGELTVIGAEPVLPYERPPLSKDVLQGNSEFDVLHDARWYGERDVRVITGTEATEIDLEVRRVTLGTGETLAYDALLIATGADPRVPSIPGGERALTLRTHADEQALRATFTDAGQLVTIGGGWIGLEVAASARQAGMEVTVLERGEVPLANVLGREIAEHLRGLHEAHGVTILTGVEALEIGDGGVVTSAGRVAADAVLAAIGVEPTTELAAAAGLAVTDGVVADTHFLTSDPHVWAAGDAALVTHATLGPLRSEHWDNAIRQGKAVARAILGQDVAYDWQPYIFTDQFEFSMEYVGHASPSDSVEIRGDLDGNEFIAYWLDDAGVITAAMNVGIWDVNDALRDLIGTVVNPTELTDLR